VNWHSKLGKQAGHDTKTQLLTHILPNTQHSVPQALKHNFTINHQLTINSVMTNLRWSWACGFPQNQSQWVCHETTYTLPPPHEILLDWSPCEGQGCGYPIACQRSPWPAPENSTGIRISHSFIYVTFAVTVMQRALHRSTVNATAFLSVCLSVTLAEHVQQNKLVSPSASRTILHSEAKNCTLFSAVRRGGQLPFCCKFTSVFVRQKLLVLLR